MVTETAQNLIRAFWNEAIAPPRPRVNTDIDQIYIYIASDELARLLYIIVLMDRLISFFTVASYFFLSVKQYFLSGENEKKGSIAHVTLKRSVLSYFYHFLPFPFLILNCSVLQRISTRLFGDDKKANQAPMTIEAKIQTLP